MVAADLLDLLRCPVTRQRLTLAPDNVLQSVNSKLGAAERCDTLLVREDGTAAYPVRGGIPVLLEDEAIALV